MHKHIRTAIRALASLLAAAALVSTGTAAFATDGPTQTDKQAGRAANRQCAPVQAPMQWEACAVGAVIRATDRALVPQDYRADVDTGPSNRLVIERGTRALQPSKGAASKADKRLMRTANRECADVMAADTQRGIDCAVGMFALLGTRVVTDADLDVAEFKGALQVTLWHRSHSVASE
jgi:hypothetical protein